MVAALFDIDGTLLACNSAPLYMKHMRRTGQARRRDGCFIVGLYAVAVVGFLLAGDR